MTRSRLAGLLVVTVAALGGCAIPDQRTPVAIRTSATTTSSSTTLAGEPARTVTAVFLVHAGRLVTVERRTRPDLDAVITHLLSGPTTAELSRGLTTAIPTGTTLESASVTGTTAALAFNNALGSISGQEQLLAFAQIVVTATARSGVDRVQIAIGGQVVNAPLADGTLAQRPVGRADYATFLPR
jgi:spore germination protein GerM